MNLAVQIARFQDVLHLCVKNLEPSTLVTYLFDLSATISAAHQRLYVKGQDQKIAEARALLFWAGRIVLHNGLVLMGLNPQERM
jgi:arginyl-tRNA synthetase